MARFVYVEWLILFLMQRHYIFEWDEGNEIKSLTKHGIGTLESETVFNDENIIPLGEQVSPITPENRYGVIGKSSEGNILFLSFTVRGEKIRIISSRQAHHKERSIYEKSKVLHKK